MNISLKTIGLFLGPLVFILISSIKGFGGVGPEGWKVLAVAAWMICWWITEATPNAIAALLPIVTFPALGVSSLAEATAPYASDVIFLFMGGFFIALGLEEHLLHKRISLNLIKLIGTSANRIILGFMLATAFLSMWISNTATAMLMLPIAASVIKLVEPTVENKKGMSLFSLSLMLGLAFSASIGGMATIIGTPPNMILVGYAKQMAGFNIDFSKWMLIGVPISLTMLIFLYWLLTHILYPNKLGELGSASLLIDSELKNLGKMSREEKMVASIFAMTAFLWIFKDPLNNLIGSKILNDTATAILGGILMFSIPVDLKNGKGLVPWEATKRLPWGVLLLFGGGMTLASGMERTGLIQIIAEMVAHNPMSLMMVFLILIGSTIILSELMGNAALATMFIPFVIGIANGLGINPLILAIPVAIATSFAFMLPISTPPSAIAYSTGHIPVLQMIKTGSLLDLFSLVLLMLASITIIPWVFG
jgi:sodium-dependent dicarboxylate transporter 2/3/5